VPPRAVKLADRDAPLTATSGEESRRASWS